MSYGAHNLGVDAHTHRDTRKYRRGQRQQHRWPKLPSGKYHIGLKQKINVTEHFLYGFEVILLQRWDYHSQLNYINNNPFYAYALLHISFVKEYVLYT